MSCQADERFDVFLSHAHTEAEAVEIIGAKLEDEAGLKVWLDKWILIPGEHWQQDMAKGLGQAKTCAVCVGSTTPSGWFREEIEKALNRQTRNRGFRVIPVILPGGNHELVDNFLELRTWVEFKQGLDDVDALHMLVCGVRGVPPGRRLNNRKNQQSDELVSVKMKLSKIRNLRDERLIDEQIALEYQRRLLDEIVKAER
jgi:TIR domain